MSQSQKSQSSKIDTFFLKDIKISEGVLRFGTTSLYICTPKSEAGCCAELKTIIKIEKT